MEVMSRTIFVNDEYRLKLKENREMKLTGVASVKLGMAPKKYGKYRRYQEEEEKREEKDEKEVTSNKLQDQQRQTTHQTFYHLFEHLFKILEAVTIVLVLLLVVIIFVPSFDMELYKDSDSVMSKLARAFKLDAESYLKIRAADYGWGGCDAC